MTYMEESKESNAWIDTDDNLHGRDSENIYSSTDSESSSNDCTKINS